MLQIFIVFLFTCT